jgi:hypothetical protein
MEKAENEDNRKLVIDTINNSSPTDTQIIEMLLLLLNDWEVRSAVMNCARAKGKPTKP